MQIFFENNFINKKALYFYKAFQRAGLRKSYNRVRGQLTTSFQ